MFVACHVCTASYCFFLYVVFITNYEVHGRAFRVHFSHHHFFSFCKWFNGLIRLLRRKRASNAIQNERKKTWKQDKNKCKQIKSFSHLTHIHARNICYLATATTNKRHDIKSTIIVINSFICRIQRPATPLKWYGFNNVNIIGEYFVCMFSVRFLKIDSHFENSWSIDSIIKSAVNENQRIWYRRTRTRTYIAHLPSTNSYKI